MELPATQSASGVPSRLIFGSDTKKEHIAQVMAKEEQWSKLGINYLKQKKKGDLQQMIVVCICFVLFFFCY